MELIPVKGKKSYKVLPPIGPENCRDLRAFTSFETNDQFNKTVLSRHLSLANRHISFYSRGLHHSGH